MPSPYSFLPLNNLTNPLDLPSNHLPHLLQKIRIRLLDTPKFTALDQGRELIRLGAGVYEQGHPLSRPLGVARLGQRFADH